MKPRTQLVTVDVRILSSYGPGGSTDSGIPRAQCRGLAAIGVGRMTPDAAAGLLALHLAVERAGGDLRITDCYRDVAGQAAARAKYDAWVAAGKPKPGTAAYNGSTMKSAYVALPGRSNHNAGRAIDVHLAALRFPGVHAEKQLDKLWELAMPLGWMPIIKSPDEAASEAWHFDFLGPWRPVQSRVGYEQAAIAAAADVGNGEAGGATFRRIQGQLHRGGFDPGKIDGLPGKATSAALTASGYRGSPEALDQVVAWVDALPDRA
jgi:hypothetical protein